MIKEKVFICDIDGTLAEHRSHRGPFDEHLVLNDTELPTVGVIIALKQAGYKIVYMSGRTDGCREDTIQWLIMKGLYPVGYNIELYMRKKGDIRGDEIVKEELYRTHVEPRYNVIGVFDDRLKVCRMWYKLGLWVYNVNQGLIEF